MDYAFVPGIGDDALEWMSGAYGRRAQTTVSVLTDKSNTLSDFLGALDFGIANGGFSQAGDLLLGAHGSDGGFFFMALDAKNPSPVCYENVQNIATIKIPAGVGTASTSVRLGSCNLGADDIRPFLVVLKQALSVSNKLTAPRFLHTFHHPGTDYWESMRYEFQILGSQDGLEPLATRDAVVGKFGDADLKLFDDTIVPIENWENWVPPAARLNLKPATKQQFDFPFYVDLPAIGGIPVNLDAGATWLSLYDHVTLHVTSSEVPGNDGAARQILFENISVDPRFKDDHPYPMYKRFGYDSLLNFISGWKWKVSSVSATELRYAGARYLYQLRIPVTDLGSGKWIFNHYPETGTPTINLTESSQPKLFGVL